MKTLDIAEVVKQSGIPASTLRYYEEIGLICPTTKKGKRRAYEQNIIEKLAIIVLGRNVGFSLQEISTAFGTNDIHIPKEQLTLKANQINESINHLISIRDGLHHAAECPAPNHLACPKFQNLLKITIINERKKSQSLQYNNAKLGSSSNHSK